MEVGQGGLKFTPNTVKAAVGDQVAFVFASGGHTVAQGEKADNRGMVIPLLIDTCSARKFQCWSVEDAPLAQDCKRKEPFANDCALAYTGCQPYGYVNRCVGGL